MESLFKDHVFAAHALVGASSAALAVSLTYPLDTIKTVVQVGSTCSSKPLSTVQVVERIKSMSGSIGGASLYSGLGWLTLGRTIGLGARFGIYEILNAFYRDGRRDNYVYVSEALMAGVVVGAAESLVAFPFELLKVRSQVTSASQCPLLEQSLEGQCVAGLSMDDIWLWEASLCMCCEEAFRRHFIGRFDSNV